MAIKTTEESRELNRVRWEKFHAERIEDRVTDLVQRSAALTPAQRARLAKIIGITPADIRDRADSA